MCIRDRFNGDFIRAYEDNGDRYRTRMGFNLTYWSDIDGEVLPGTQYNLNGNYGTTSFKFFASNNPCLLYTSPSPRDRTRSRMPSSA